ncbi:hypothetical protein NATSA_05850 [Natronogracilivirgula saccharolytica]|uniref:Uncharacterized protein n=2 Tax=Natronogracilivirga saccharolytica TaxID=2812953 RepID=A0A8J7UV42_9BACT|nr:hypothetical protein [Natronogracilivirga saccharolytica]
MPSYFLTIRALVFSTLVAMPAVWTGMAEARFIDIDHPVKMPAHFQHGLIFVEPVSQDGDTLRFFTDTADGSLMYEDTARRLELTTTSAIINDREQEAAFLPPFADDHYIPSPIISDGLIPLRSDDRKPPHHRVILKHGNGILGSTWFAMRTWTINFPEETFYVQPTDEDARNLDPGETIPISFAEEDGDRRYHFARLPVVIGSDTLSLVLKTGSNIILDESGKEQLDHPDHIFPAGLISESQFRKWREENPDWNVFDDVDINYNGDLIKVPEIQIGSYTAGPVHFAVRNDDAFADWFSQFTDEPVTGALGADAFRSAHITIDYFNAELIIHD